MDRSGEIRFHRNMPNDFALLADVLKPYRRHISIGVESIYNWYWLADGCHQAGVPFYLGHALYMKAIHGGKKKNDRLDSQTLADLMRSNFFPLAYAYPQTMRATRDLLRRRHRFVALRAEGYSHIQNTFAQHANFDLCREEIRRKTTRRSIPQRLADPDLTLSMDCDLDLIDTLDGMNYTIEKQILTQAKHGLAKAKIRIAHKLALAVYHMLKNGQAFDEKRFVSS